MEIRFNVFSKAEFISQILIEENDKKGKNLVDRLNDDIFIFYEKPYIDKVYRDSYYHYYSSKHQEIERDCSRVSLFSKPIKYEDFFDSTKIELIQDSYLGFFVRRPTFSKFLGRSMISPKAYKNHAFLSCLVSVKSQIFGIPLEVHGFPHSSQDGHTITCAETTIWAIMEYFGNRYTEYCPTLPSEITKVLSSSYTHRVYPSEGLTAIQISKALKEFNFGVMLYSTNGTEEENSKLFKTISTYVESGIPVILSVTNKKILGHAVIVCGHEDIILKDELHLFEKLASVNANLIENIEVFETSQIQKSYVFIDDNQPPFILANFERPFDHYKEQIFKDAKILNAIVPLYSKIYLDEKRAQVLFGKLIRNELYGLSNLDIKSRKLLSRIYLTSSRSFKRDVLKSTKYTDENKSIILSRNLPKFIWVCELNTPANYLGGMVDVKLVLDATGNGDLNSLVFAHYPKLIYINDGETPFKKLVVDFPNVEIYRNNLKGDWNSWLA